MNNENNNGISALAEETTTTSTTTTTTLNQKETHQKQPLEPNKSDIKTTKTNNQETTQKRNTTEKPELTGLQNAITRVKNNETQQHLKLVLEKIETKQLEQLNKLQNLSVEQKNGKTIIEGKIKTKFLGVFPANRHVQYEYNPGLGIKKKGIFGWLFKDEDEE